MFQQALLTWFEANKRDMPWRRTYAPYHIWLSEIMLQQTQVATVIPYFERYIKKYPTIEDLAEGDETEVLKLWEGLGYYSRARRLIPCAQQVMRDHNGKFPKDYKTLIKLPGIGPYTAGAILSIAYNLKFPAVDGNVKRVFSRMYEIDEPVNDPKQHKVFETLVQEVIPDDARNFNQAIMELGALICKPSSPNCGACPVTDNCLAYKNGHQQVLPLYKKKPDKKIRRFCVGLILNDDKLLVEFRDQETLLGQMWGLPAVEIEDKGYPEIALKEYLDQYGLSIDSMVYVGEIKHVFTHQIWQMGIFKQEIPEQVALKRGKWHAINKLDELTIGTGFRKVLKYLEE